MTQDDRLLTAVTCLRVLATLFGPGELRAISFDLAEPDTIGVTIGLPGIDERFIELYTKSADHPLDLVLPVFDQLQQFLAEENGPTRGEARPHCRDGHTHPATCHRKDDGLFLVCPVDLEPFERLA
ncbi:MAG: hypothetical protein ACJ74U_13320 [Jatrophihabitantaceae bacterium]